jgi:hypothetical protein
MAAPGTLIPADLPSLKGTTNYNYNPILTTAATDNPSEELFRPHPSNQFSEEILIVNQLPATPPHIFSTATLTAGTSTSGAIPLDHHHNLNQLPIIGSSSSEPFNETVKPLDDMQEIDDTRKLFADLNPFGKVVALDSRINTGGFQRRRENVSPGPSRPQQPLVMKNWSAYNEEPFQRRNKNVNDNSASSSSQRPPLMGKSPYINTKDPYGNNSDNSFLGNKVEMQVSSVQQPAVLKGHLENVNGMHTMKKNPNDRLMGDVMGKKTVESAVSLSQSRQSRLDPMLDDVSECEILWEDLVIGERIGLGTLLHFCFFGSVLLFKFQLAYCLTGQIGFYSMWQNSF